MDHPSSRAPAPSVPAARPAPAARAAPGRGSLVVSLLLAAGSGALGVGSLGCGAVKARPPVRPAAESTVTARFTPPFALANPEDAVVRIVLPNMTCTGTAVEEDLILTAHHCVVRRGPQGEFLRESVEPESIRVELGGDYFAWGEVKVKAVVAPPCGEKGGAGDVAVLVLERKLVGLGTLSPRLDSPPKIGESVDPVGFGRCATSGDAIRRRTRDGGPIRATNGDTFFMDASVCPGDSGGPVMTRGGHQVVGVVSLSAMDGDESTKAPSIMARVDAFRNVFAYAHQLAAGATKSELPPLSCE